MKEAIPSICTRWKLLSDIDTQLTIFGIGVRVRMEDGYATIERIFPRGAAERSGKLQVGDIIVGVAQGDGPFVNIVHKELDKFTEMVLGTTGSVSVFKSSPIKRKIRPNVARAFLSYDVYGRAHRERVERLIYGG
jgi:C-terminal processing protease CtpA/Prc